MKIFRKILIMLLVLAMAVPCSLLVPSADGEDWIYIDGENITRQAGMTVIYTGVETIGANQWGFNVVVDSSGAVTDIIRSQDNSGNIAVPEGGMVISAEGDRADWLYNNVYEGKTVFYDPYTHRLFVRDYYGNFEPYFTKSFKVEKSNSEYILSEFQNTDNRDYTYKVAVNAEGVIIARGKDASAPEGGFTVSATNEEDRKLLVAHGIIGGECKIDEDTVTFNFQTEMLSRSASLAIVAAKEALAKARSEYAFADISSLDKAIKEAEDDIDSINGFRKLSGLLVSLEEAVENYTVDNNFYELRGAFHVPYETNEDAVRQTVEKAKDAGLNTIILRVSNGYGTFIQMPENSKFQTDGRFRDYDVLKGFIDVCKEEGVALTLCIETYYNEFASIAAPNWLSATNSGEAGISNKYFSPASKEFQSYFVQYVEYIVTHYDLDSVMLDYLRYPKFNEETDLGYDSNTLQLFAAQEKISVAELDSLKTQLQESQYWDKWVAFKTGLVNDLAKAVSDVVREKRSDITLLAVAERDATDHFYMQDAAGWVENGWFDGLAVSFLQADEEENDPLSEVSYFDGIVEDKTSYYAKKLQNSGHLFTALETSFPLDGDVLQSAVKDSRSAGADGFIFKSLSDFFAQNYHIALQDNVLKGGSASPLGEKNDVMKALLEYAKAQITDSIVYNYNACDGKTAMAASSLINGAINSLEEAPLTKEQVSELRDGISDAFGESGAKDKVMREFDALYKFSLLAKEDNGQFVPPVEETPDEEVSQEVRSEEVSEAVSNGIDTSSRLDININFGDVLIYVFVGITFVGVIAAAIVSVKRKNRRPANAHMPKGYEDNQ